MSLTTSATSISFSSFTIPFFFPFLFTSLAIDACLMLHFSFTLPGGCKETNEGPFKCLQCNRLCSSYLKTLLFLPWKTCNLISQGTKKKKDVKHKWLMSLWTFKSCETNVRCGPLTDQHLDLWHNKLSPYPAPHCNRGPLTIRECQSCSPGNWHCLIFLPWGNESTSTYM